MTNHNYLYLHSLSYLNSLLGTLQLHGAECANGQGAGGPPARSGQGKWLLNLAIQGLLGGVPLQVGKSLVQSLSRGSSHGGGSSGAGAGGCGW